MPRSCLRQPSTPALSQMDRTAVPRPGQAGAGGRSRAASTAADTRPPLGTSALLFEPSFAESREPSVPPHIRVRLRLIHQLGVVLGMDAQGISNKIDVPGLLARVDAAYDRGHASVAMVAGGESNGSMASSSLPLPLRPVVPAETAGMVTKGSKGGNGRMMGMIKRLGRKSLGDEPGVGGGGGGGMGSGETPTFSSGSAEGEGFFPSSVGCLLIKRFFSFALFRYLLPTSSFWSHRSTTRWQARHSVYLSTKRRLDRGAPRSSVVSATSFPLSSLPSSKRSIDVVSPCLNFAFLSL